MSRSILVNFPVRLQFNIIFTYIYTTHQQMNKIKTFLTDSQPEYVISMCYNESPFVAHVIASHSLFRIKRKHAVLLASFTLKWRVWLVNFTTWCQNGS